MKQFLKIIMLTVIAISFTGIVSAQCKKLTEEQEKLLAPYPEAEQEMVRHVIFLKKQKEESQYKVEIIPGKVMNVDCNNHSLMGKLDDKTVQGWGYSYYEFTSNGQTRSTMMACNTPNEDRFIASESKLIRYNSKLPIVVYAPKGYEVKYTVWKAGKPVDMQVK